MACADGPRSDPQRAERPRLPRVAGTGRRLVREDRLPDGRQVKRRIGRAWTDRGRPAEGYYTKRTAERWLADVLEQARRGTLPGMIRTGATFADAAEEFLRYIEHDRARKPSTIKGYRWLITSRLLPAFGARRLEDITTHDVEAWLGELSTLAPSSRTKALVLLQGIFKRARKRYGLAFNPAAEVEKPRQRLSGDIAVFSPEEVWALVRAAESLQDGAVFLTGAFTGLRLGELIALRWRDVDFTGSVIRVRASYSAGALTTPKSGKVRSVPMAPDVAALLARLGDRGHSVGDDELVFPGEAGAVPGRLGAAAPLQACARSRRSAATALSRPTPHVRHARDRQGRRPARAGVDGPRRHPDDDEVPALRAAARGCAIGR